MNGKRDVGILFTVAAIGVVRYMRFSERSSAASETHDFVVAAVHEMPGYSANSERRDRALERAHEIAFSSEFKTGSRRREGGSTKRSRSPSSSNRCGSK